MKLKNRVIVTIQCVLLLLVCIFICSCDKHDPPVSINRSVKNFNAIVVETPVLVYLYQANYNFLRLEGNEIDIKKITTESKDKKLFISSDKSRDQGSDSATLVVVQCNELVSIEHASSGRLVSKMPLKLSNLKITNRRNGKIKISGIASSIELKNLSVGIIDMENFNAQNVNVQIEGTGSVWVDSSDVITADILGSGNVYYKGNPAINRKGQGRGQCIQIIE